MRKTAAVVLRIFAGTIGRSLRLPGGRINWCGKVIVTDKTKLLELLANGPVIAAVKDEAGLKTALSCEVSVVFLLYGDILSVGSVVQRAHEAGKAVFVHLDLVDGLSTKEIAVDFLARSTAADGVISTRAALTKRARELGLVGIQRFFLLDSMAFQNIERHFTQDSSDLIEVLPGLMPKMIRKVAQVTRKPIIAGGLITDKEDVTGALSAGAVAVSTTNPQVWLM